MTKKNIVKYIDWILLITLCVLVIMAWIDGRYIQNTITIIETCNNEPINQTLWNLTFTKVGG